ncbi:MAG: hypothetical protein ACP5RV_11060, partial [Thiomonas sp.]
AFYDKERLISTTYATFTAALLTDSGFTQLLRLIDRICWIFGVFRARLLRNPERVCPAAMVP